MQSPESMIASEKPTLQSQSGDVDELGVFPQSARVDELEGNGISKSDINKLKEANIFTVAAVAYTTKRHLATVKGISEAKAAKLQEAAYQMVDMGFMSGAETYVRHEQLISISTGSKALDTLMRGGIETGSLTEIFGEYRTGKSQLCHQLAVTCQLPLDMNGGEGRCMFLDSEGTFRPERVAAIANRYGLNPEETLGNIAVARIYNNEHMMLILEKAAAMLSQSRFSIIIVDSIMAPLRTDFSGRGELSERQSRLAAILRKLRNLADEFGVAVVYTNQVTAQVDGLAFGPDPKKPIGGNIMAHASTTRLMFKKHRGETRTCRVCDSPCLPESDCQFGIYEDGIDDVRDKDPTLDEDN